ncbi:unnamed protein product [Soboliphyme baturini]|uniref:Reverse transcriptase n=1 Tax=Soboliphyme baturini TaxID=241478 RepID=A0A183IHT5_9BILA|nr:unnamed protein product [Soboliphyme baturini]
MVFGDDGVAKFLEVVGLLVEEYCFFHVSGGLLVGDRREGDEVYRETEAVRKITRGGNIKESEGKSLRGDEEFAREVDEDGEKWDRHGEAFSYLLAHQTELQEDFETLQLRKWEKLSKIAEVFGNTGEC